MKRDLIFRQLVTAVLSVQFSYTYADNLADNRNYINAVAEYDWQATASCLGVNTATIGCLAVTAAGGAAMSLLLKPLQRRSDLKRAEKWDKATDRRIVLELSTKDKLFPYWDRGYPIYDGRFETERQILSHNERIDMRKEEIKSLTRKGAREGMPSVEKQIRVLQAEITDIQNDRTVVIRSHYSDKAVGKKMLKAAGWAALILGGLNAIANDDLEKASREAKKRCVPLREVADEIVAALSIGPNCSLSMKREFADVLAVMSKEERRELLEKAPILVQPIAELQNQLQAELNTEVKAYPLSCDVKHTLMRVEYQGRQFDLSVDNIQRVDGRPATVRGALIPGDDFPAEGFDQSSFSIEIDRDSRMGNLNSNNINAGYGKREHQNAAKFMERYLLQSERKILDENDRKWLQVENPVPDFGPKVHATIGMQLLGLKRALPAIESYCRAQINNRDSGIPIAPASGTY